MPDRGLKLVAALVLIAALQQFLSAGLIHAKAWLAPMLVERAWAATLASDGAPHRPWPWADTWPVAQLSVPKLQVSRHILYGDGGHALAFGPGLDSGLGLPGEEGVTLVSGHRDTHFAFLRDLRPEMRLVLQRPSGDVHAYRVVDAVTVDSRWQGLPLLSAPEQLLLVTCYPFDAIRANGPLRRVVRALPIPGSRGTVAQGSSSS